MNKFVFWEFKNDSLNIYQFSLKNQFENKLNPKEEKGLRELDTQNLKAIHEVYESLKNDKRIEKLIQKIKSHKWVKIIKGIE